MGVIERKREREGERLGERDTEIERERWAQLNGEVARDQAVLAGVQSLGCVSVVKHRPSKLALQAGDPEHGKIVIFFLSLWLQDPLQKR